MEKDPMKRYASMTEMSDAWATAIRDELVFH
jgi:hypothetical protein